MTPDVTIRDEIFRSFFAEENRGALRNGSLRNVLKNVLVLLNVFVVKLSRSSAYR